MPGEYNQALGEAEQADLIEEEKPDEVKEQDFTSIVDDEIRSMIINRFEASRQWKQAKVDKWDICNNHYHQIYDTTNKEAWQSQMFVPASPKVAETICANMHAATLGPEQPAEYQPRLPEYGDAIRDVNELIKVDLDKGNFKVKWTDITRSKCILGTGIGKIEYRKEYAKVKVKKRVKPNPALESIRGMIGLPPQPTEIIEEQEMLVKDYAEAKYVDPYDFFPQPGIEDISKDTWVIERGKIKNYELLALQDDKDNPVTNITDDLLMNNPDSPLDDSDKQEKDLAGDDLVTNRAYMDPDQEHELLEYWGPAPLWMCYPEVYGQEEFKYEVKYAWFWLIDKKWVVRKQITPNHDAEPPYTVDQYIRVPGQFWGVGPLELIIGLQIELNELRNTRQDNINLALNRIIAVIKEHVPKGEWGKLVSSPGALWIFSQSDDIKKSMMPIEMPDITKDSWQASQEIYNEIQEVTAATKATIGTGGGDDQYGAGTFRGQLLNKQTSGERFIMYARTSEKTGLSKAIEKIYSRIYQYKDYEQVAEILGPERAQNFEFIPPERLPAMAKLVPTGVTTMENKGVKLAQMRDEFQMWAQFPWFKQIEHARRMKEIAGDDPDNTIFTDEELQQYNEAKRQMEQQLLAEQEQNAQLNGVGPTNPVAGDTPPDVDGGPQPSLPSRGPGASPIDSQGVPL